MSYCSSVQFSSVALYTPLRLVNDVKSLEFTVTRVLMKIFKTNSKDIVIECKRYFGFRDVHELITQRKRAFLAAFNANDSSICNVCKHVADRI